MVTDFMTFGAPCQDLSVAGKRAGMKSHLMGDEEQTRSGLFFEAVRLIKEMREYDSIHNRRTGVYVRCRYALYENVPGALTSNKGDDWWAVLEELVRVKRPGLSIPRPEKWKNRGIILGDDFSLAWRVFDSQFWGTTDWPTPQRRRRIALVADFGAQSAPEILFVRESVSGNTTESGKAWEETPGNSGESASEGCGNRAETERIGRKRWFRRWLGRWFGKLFRG